jgi:hypothetical protein
MTAFSQVKHISSESTIQLVTVFSSGAQIQREATLAIAAGKTEIVFSGLSNQLDQQGLQLKADANITLLSVQTEKDFFSKRKIENEELSLLDRRNGLALKIEDQQKLLLVFKNEEEMVIKNQAIGGSEGVKADELKKALDLQRQRLTEIYAKELEIERSIKSMNLELQTVNSHLAEMGRKKDSVSNSVIALIDSKESRNIKFQLIYTIKDAGWYPVYDARVNEVGSPLAFLMNANVFQRSGETWKDVSLLLSTGSPKDNATPSLLQPWMLGFYDPSVAWMKNQSVIPGVITGRVVDQNGQPIPGATVQLKGTHIATATDANGFFKFQNVPANAVVVISSVGFTNKEVLMRPGYYTVALSENANAMSEVIVVGYGTNRSETSDDFVAGRKQKEEIQTVSVQTQYQPTTIIYKIEEKYSIETDGKTTTIGIKQFNVPAEYQYFATPKIDASVFLTAKITNWEDYDLQSGEANLYFEGTYLGKTYIDLSEVGDTLSLSLGKDNGVKISRKLVKEFSSKKLIGSNRTETKQYEITIRNTKKTAVNIVVQDQYPVSTNKDIEVNDVKAAGAQIEKATGIANWNITLQPGEEKKLQLSYSVKYPKERRVDL